jgi:hypothetical protein
MNEGGEGCNSSVGGFLNGGYKGCILKRWLITKILGKEPAHRIQTTHD